MLVSSCLTSADRLEFQYSSRTFEFGACSAHRLEIQYLISHSRVLFCVTIEQQSLTRFVVLCFFSTENQPWTSHAGLGRRKQFSCEQSLAEALLSSLLHPSDMIVGTSPYMLLQLLAMFYVLPFYFYRNGNLARKRAFGDVAQASDCNSVFRRSCTVRSGSNLNSRGASSVSRMCYSTSIAKTSYSIAFVTITACIAAVRPNGL